MKKIKIIILIVSLFFNACSESDTEIRLSGNIYLIKFGDDIHSGYILGKKIDEHNSEILLNENVTEVYWDSAQVFIKSMFGEHLTYFHKIQLKKDSSKRLNVSDIKESSYNEMVEHCLSCKRIQIIHDTISNKWILKK